MPAITREQAWKILENVKDPEIPVVSVVEMGIIREVQIEDETVRVTMTPTFSGCPALQVMQDEIQTRLEEAGASRVEVKISHNPPWSSDWISPEAREKLKNFGLSPPPMHGGHIDLALLEVARCPYCGAEDTSLKNSFGPTLCRAIYYCNKCRQPFEQFKPL
jgi:ring-1,2-phenylacetyl-CoA epoxidase subunit PaaD